MGIIHLLRFSVWTFRRWWWPFWQRQKITGNNEKKIKKTKNFAIKEVFWSLKHEESIKNTFTALRTLLHIENVWHRWLLLQSLFQNALFLDASSHLYKRLCPSVRRSVGRSVRRSVRRSPVFFGFDYRNSEWLWVTLDNSELLWTTLGQFWSTLGQFWTTLGRIYWSTLGLVFR